MASGRSTSRSSNRFPSASSSIEEVYKKASPHPIGNPGLKFTILVFSIAFAVEVSRFHPPPPKICGTLHGPSVTAPQLRLPDGRPVAISEAGVPRSNASFKVIVVHDYGASRLDLLPCTRETLDSLGVYLVSYDRAGYGESHPFPHRSIASEAHDIEHLADTLEMGAKFHVISIGVGAYAAWGCLQYIPHRLAGIAIVAPVANFWWPGLPLSESQKALMSFTLADRSTLLVAHYAPWLLNWWMSKNWLPSSNIEQLTKSKKISVVAIQQGVQESIHRDLTVQFGSWNLDPAVIENPVSGSVHLWQTRNDPFFPSSFQRWIKSRLPWIQYHIIPGETNSLLHITGLPEEILSKLLMSEQKQN